jgi:hypothetical protein
LYFCGPAVLFSSSTRRRPVTTVGAPTDDQKESISMSDRQRSRTAMITPAMPLDRVLTALRHCTDRELRAMSAHCRQRADEATETGYVGAGALFAALADLATAEQYDREQAARAVDEALSGWRPCREPGVH